MSLTELYRFMGFCFDLLEGHDDQIVRNPQPLISQIESLSAMPVTVFATLVEQLQNMLAIYVVSLVAGDSTKPQI